jgi:predicted RNA-binding Zn-ribbon protein involved in translation (DUF1610 family)
MNVSAFVQGLSFVPALASRPFLVAFILSLTPQWGPLLPDATVIPLLGAPVPTLPWWFTALPAVVILGLLTGAEMLVIHNQDLRWMHEEFSGGIRAVVTLGVAFGLVNNESAALVGTLIGDGGPTSMIGAIGSLISTIWAFVSAFFVWLVGWMRGIIFNALMELDEDDDLGLQSVLLWLEDFGILGGVFLAAILPLVALTLFGLTLLTLFLVEKFFEHQAERRKISCSACGTKLHASALACSHCGQRTAAPRQVGAFGQATPQTVSDVAAHQLHLISKKRCPVCATRLEKKAISQPCPACGRDTFASAPAVDEYLAMMRQRLPLTTAITFGFGFIPLVGLVPAIVYYRLSLIAGLRAYVPRSIGCLARYGVRLLNMGLIALQAIPFLGMVALPLMVLSNFFIYERILVRERDRAFTAGVLPESARSYTPPASHQTDQWDDADAEGVKVDEMTNRPND